MGARDEDINLTTAFASQRAARPFCETARPSSVAPLEAKGGRQLRECERSAAPSLADAAPELLLRAAQQYQDFLVDQVNASRVDYRCSQSRASRVRVSGPGDSQVHDRQNRSGAQLRRVFQYRVKQIMTAMRHRLSLVRPNGDHDYANTLDENKVGPAHSSARSTSC